MLDSKRGTALSKMVVNVPVLLGIVFLLGIFMVLAGFAKITVIPSAIPSSIYSFSGQSILFDEVGETRIFDGIVKSYYIDILRAGSPVAEAEKRETGELLNLFRDEFLEGISSKLAKENEELFSGEASCFIYVLNFDDGKNAPITVSDLDVTGIRYMKFKDGKELQSGSYRDRISAFYLDDFSRLDFSVNGPKFRSELKGESEKPILEDAKKEFTLYFYYGLCDLEGSNE